MGVFSKNQGPEESIKRNPFDMSFHNNLTMKMGYLYPCFCKEVVSGDSVKIDSALGLRFMPTAFPLQTKVKAYVDFFYVRNRTLWKDFMNYLFGTGQPSSFPVMSKSQLKKLARTGELGDYLGLPTTLIGGKNHWTASFRTSIQVHANYSSFIGDITKENSSREVFYGYWLRSTNPADGGTYTIDLAEVKALPTKDVAITENASASETYYMLPLTLTTAQKEYAVDHTFLVKSTMLRGNADNNCQISPFAITGRVGDGGNSIYHATVTPDGMYNVPAVYFDFVKGDIGISQSYLENTKYEKLSIAFAPLEYVGVEIVSPVAFSLRFSPIRGNVPSGIAEFQDSYEFPFDISALPFRAYEQIYNAFYRDNRNNPYIVNGVEDPNVFLPTTDGGVDNNDYVLHKRNYEQDFLTTAMVSPQYGDAPLVGVSASGTASFRDSDGNIIRSQLITDESGDKVVSFETTDNAQVNHSLVQLASEGFSINTLRGVNALQRFLETNYRRGLRYKDQLQAHFGVDVAYNILDMPEYIGGYTQLCNVTQIDQTSASTDSDPLGSYAGQMSAIGGQSSKIQKFCDENGYIIGIISVVPVPTYSQLMPKHFLKTKEPLDFYFPEFAHLGMQPVKYNEVCPCQAVAEDVSTNDVFGYQRAWYDYLASTDEVHGLFRTSLSSFVLARVYDSVPSLNEKFLTVDPANLNDVFTVNEVDGEPIDPILGQIHFDATFMRPIPRYNNPSLE